ncbi:MAG TPA: isomerase [Pusillimonas sp.]|jgi:steroid delta-isomerase|nr:isomerase [Pusillimonas sp.]HCN73037.1 isomerase [Pusillimonas sp.]|tara:strand:+ start:127802 stop:128248 length:447 start_codon:yes stop_codon:yes gene_type:complete
MSSGDIQRVVAFYENLSPEHLEYLHEVYDADAAFTDPFNDVVGIEAILRIFKHMYATVHQPVFNVDEAVSQGQNGFLTWTFTFQTGKKTKRRDWTVKGATHVRFNAQGKVCKHDDYWDPAQSLYEKTPLVGGVFRWLRRRLSATSGSQ